MASKLLYECCDRRNKRVLDYQHVLPNQAVEHSVQATKLFDDGCDRRSTDDFDYLDEVPSLQVTEMGIHRKEIDLILYFGTNLLF